MGLEEFNSSIACYPWCRRQAGGPSSRQPNRSHPPLPPGGKAEAGAAQPLIPDVNYPNMLHGAGQAEGPSFRDANRPHALLP